MKNTRPSDPYNLVPLLIAVLFVVWLSATLTAQTAPQHVVLVLLDDVGIDKIGCYGHPTAGPTPIIDSLAAGGVRFTRAYGNPTCSPTRACVLTGRYGSRTGIDTGVPTFDPAVNPNGSFLPADSEPWLPLMLNAAGVRSYLVGKWHLSHIDDADYHQDPISKGFVRWRGHASNLNAESPYAWTKQAADPLGWAETTRTLFVTTDNANEAWLALQASAGSKSFVMLAFNAAHPPWDILPPVGLYTPVAGTQTQAKKQQYALQAADTLLGQLMAFYATQLPVDAAQTLWIVMGDNGTPAAATEGPTNGWQHKATVYEGGVHVPLIVWGAGVGDPGRVDSGLVSQVDIHATLLELFGLPEAAGTDAVSFAPRIVGPAASARSAVYVREGSPNGFGPKDYLQQAAIDEHWALLRRAGAVGGPAVELFNLDSDLDESSNLWPPSTPEEQAAVDTLQAVIDASD